MVRKLSSVSFALLALSLLTVSAPEPARASTFRAMSVEELTRSSAAVVEGTVLSLESSWNAERTLIFTEAEVRVDRTLVGEEGRRITVRTVGGTVADVRIVADGFPTFSVGERVMLFLTPDRDRFQVTGYKLGHFRVEKGADGQDMAFPTVDPAMLRQQPSVEVRPRSLQELRESVHRAVAARELRRQEAPFVLLNPPRTWDFPPVVVVDDRGISSIDDDDNGVSHAVAAINSLDAWNGAGAGTIILATAGNVAGFTLGDGIPMINFQDPLGVCTGNCFAATFTGFFFQRPDGTWRIFDADVVFNSREYSWTSEGEDPGGCGCDGEIYVESRVVHETGHVLGLANSPVEGATMFGVFLAACDNSQATIEADDAAGILALYGG